MTDMGTVVETSGWVVGGSPILAIQLFQVIRYYSNDSLYLQIKRNQVYQIQFRHKHIGRELGWWVGGSQALTTQLFHTFTYYCKCLPAIKRALNILSAIT